MLRSTARSPEIKMPQNTEGLVGWLVARVRDLQRKSETTRPQMHLVETLPLGGRRQLMLVACGGEHFLIGGGPDSVETIVRTTPVEGAPQSQDGLCG